MRYSADLNSMLGNIEQAPTQKSPQDEFLRLQYAKYAIRQHGWKDDVLPQVNSEGKFVIDWLEAEYQVFKAGYHVAVKQY